MLYREHKVIFLNVLAEKREYYWHCDPECRPLTDGDMCNTLLPVIKTTTDWTPLTNRLRAWDPCTPWIPWSVKECSSGFKWVVFGGTLSPRHPPLTFLLSQISLATEFSLLFCLILFFSLRFAFNLTANGEKKYKRQQKASLGTPYMTRSLTCPTELKTKLSFLIPIWLRPAQQTL